MAVGFFKNSMDDKSSQIDDYNYILQLYFCFLREVFAKMAGQVCSFISLNVELASVLIFLISAGDEL